MFQVFARSLPLKEIGWKIGQVLGAKLIEYLDDMVLSPAISRIRDYFQSPKADGSSGDDLLIRQRPVEPWLEAVTPKILNQLTPEDGNSLFIMTPETVLGLKDEIGANRYGADVYVRRLYGGIYEVKVCGSTVGTVEPLTTMSNSRSPYSHTGQQASFRRHNMNNVEKSPYVVFNTATRSRRDSIAYVYPQRRNAVESLAKSGSADDSMMVIGSDMNSSITVASPSAKSRTVTKSRDVSAIYICSPAHNSHVLDYANSSAILVCPKHYHGCS